MKMHFRLGVGWVVTMLAFLISLSPRLIAANIGLKPFCEGFTSPIALVPFPDGKGSLLIADQVGTVSLVSRSGVLRGQAFLSLSDRLTKLNQGFDERGLLGLALHPSFSKNGKLYVYYSAPLRSGAAIDWNHTSRLSEFTTRKDDRERVDMSSERILLEFDQPHFNHNGGCIAFGPDGYLYIASGDGGNANGIGRGHSPLGNGQDLSNLLGKILRIDVDHGEPYSIPDDNPFSGENLRAEIFALGFRNPWRFSFDRGGEHALFAADVGQVLYEEVDIIIKGGNYGWNIREGHHCFDPKNPKQSPIDCAETDIRGAPFIEPIIEYKNAAGFGSDSDAKGISITGGYVYRGQAIEHLQGAYVFADWTLNWSLPKGSLYFAKQDSNENWKMHALPLKGKPNGKIDAYITAFGEDSHGELYILTNGLNGLSHRKGKVYKLVPM